MTTITYKVTFHPYNASTKTATVIATAHPASGRDADYWYATAPGAGCSKDFRTSRDAVKALVSDDLGAIILIESTQTA